MNSKEYDLSKQYERKKTRVQVSKQSLDQYIKKMNGKHAKESKNTNEESFFKGGDYDESDSEEDLPGDIPKKLGHKIQKLEEENKFLKKVDDIDDVLPQHPFFFAILAQRNSGKTTLLVNLLMNGDMYGGKFDYVHIWSPTIHIDGNWKKLKLNKERTHTDYETDDFSNLLQEIEEGEMEGSHLIVIDDMTEKIKDDRNMRLDIEKLAFKARHWNVSVIIVSHQLKFLSAATRTSISDLILFNIQSATELDKLIEENRGLLSKKEFLRIYNEAVKEPYGFLYIKRKEPLEKRFRKGFDQILKVQI